MTEQMKAATIRALYGGLLTAALVFFTALQVESRSRDTIEDAAIAAVVALLGYMISRGVAEGLIDSARASSGNVLPSDVGQGR